MASNDMNSWDKDPDELLRRRWQQTFANFEVRPRPGLSRQILGQVPARRRPTLIYWLAGGVWLLLGGGLLWLTRSQESADAELTITSRYSGQRLAKPLTRDGRKKDVSPPEQVFAHQPSEETSPPTSQKTKTVAPAHPNAARMPARSGRSAAIRAGTEPLLPVAFQSERPTAGTRQAGQLSPALTSQPGQAGRQAATAQGTAQWSPQPLDVTPLVLAHNELPHPFITLPPASTPPAQATVAHPAHRWFIEVAPLSSFQWMSTPATSTAYLSQVGAPAALSPATWGYQVSGGISFRHWQARLLAGHLRRWAYYTVSENRYRLEPSPTNPYQLVRESYAVAENALLPMVGAGLLQRRLLGRARYAAELGGQLWYLPVNDRALLGLRGAASRRLLGPRAEWHVGLSAEYGLSQLFSEQQHLTIHPLVIGLNLRIQPTGRPSQQ